MDVDQRVTEVKESDCSPETVLVSLWNKVTSDMRFVFLSTLIIGLITHLFVFTNKFIGYDELKYAYGNEGMQMGRWLLWSVTQLTSDNYSMPWANGFISLVLISISTCLIVSIFDIRSRLHMLLIGGLMMTFPVVCCTFCFMFTSVAYFLSLMLAVWSVWLTRKYRWGFIWGGVLLVFSLGIYQAYICMSIALFAICVLKETLEDDTDNRTLFIHIGKYLACGIIGVVGYNLVLQIVLAYMGDVLCDHQGFDEFTLSSLVRIGALVSVIRELVRFFVLYGYGITGMLSWLFRIATFFTAVMILIYTIKLCISKQKRTHKTFQMVLAFGVLFTLPIWINGICLAAESVHYLMIYSYVTLYILLIVLIEMSSFSPTSVACCKGMQAGRWITFCCMITMVYVGYLAANECYLKLNLVYERTYALTLQIIDHLEQMEELDLKHTPVALVWMDESTNCRPQLPQGTLLEKIRYEWTRAKINAEKLGGRFSAPRFFTQSDMFLNGSRFQLMSEQYFQKKFMVSSKKDGITADSSEVQAMPCFPAKDSIREVDGIIVVKIAPEMGHIGFYW